MGFLKPNLLFAERSTAEKGTVEIQEGMIYLYIPVYQYDIPVYASIPVWYTSSAASLPTSLW